MELFLRIFMWVVVALLQEVLIGYTFSSNVANMLLWFTPIGILITSGDIKVLTSKGDLKFTYNIILWFDAIYIIVLFGFAHWFLGIYTAIILFFSFIKTYMIAKDKKV